MTELKNKVSYVSILMILFGLIAMFFICRNYLIINNNVEVEATCYSYEFKNNNYIVSYFYKYNGNTYYIKKEESTKPKISSKIIIYCNKSDTTKCITDKNKYLRGIYISILSLIPVIIFLILDSKRHRIKNVTHKKAKSTD